MKDDTLRIVRTETKIYDVDISDAPDYVDDIEDWAKNHALINTERAERVETKLGELEAKGKETGEVEN